MTATKPRILALFGTRVIFGAERENIEVLAALREQGCDVLCLVRHEAGNDHIPAALMARGLAWRKVPYIDGWLRGWRSRVAPQSRRIHRWQLAVPENSSGVPPHAYPHFQCGLPVELPSGALRCPYAGGLSRCRFAHTAPLVLAFALALHRDANKSICSFQPLYCRGARGDGSPAERIEVIYGCPPEAS